MRITTAGTVTLLATTLVGAAVSAAQQPASSSAGKAAATTSRASAKATIVLVHGAFADATGWQTIIPLLQQDGYKVVAVQNAMASLAGDVETTKRLIDAQSGPMVVVGHSYGGAVITGAAAGNSNVKALVYLAAFAPEAGEPIGAFGDKYPADLGKALVTDAGGYLSVDPSKFHALFAADLPKRDADIAAVTQKPIIATIFGQSVSAAAWKTIPSWYVVTTQDHAINPDLERFYAKRMKARTTEIASSHVVFISHPREVVKVIIEAAGAQAKIAAAGKP